MMLNIAKVVLEFVIPLGGVCVFGWGVWQYYHSQSLVVFQRYCDRYNAIVTPDIIAEWTKVIEGWKLGDEEPNKRIERAMLAYLNLVWEEFQLHNQRLIRTDIWEAWSPGIEETVNSDFARSVLKRYRNHFSEFDQKSVNHKIADVLGIKTLD